VPGSLTDLAGLRVDAEEFLAAVLEAAAQPIWVVGPDGLIRFANAAAIAALEDFGEIGGAIPADQRRQTRSRTARRGDRAHRGRHARDPGARRRRRRRPAGRERSGGPRGPACRPRRSAARREPGRRRHARHPGDDCSPVDDAFSRTPEGFVRVPLTRRRGRKDRWAPPSQEEESPWAHDSWRLTVTPDREPTAPSWRRPRRNLP
jgi:PAS domain-containing protein